MKTKHIYKSVNRRTMEMLRFQHDVRDSSKPLINEIREVAERSISFDELMRLAYCQPKWQWN